MRHSARFGWIASLLLLAAVPGCSPGQDYLEPYRKVLSHVDSEGLVDYAALADKPSALKATSKAISGVDRKTYDSWTKSHRLAFLINAYNAFTLELIVDRYPIPTRDEGEPAGSIRQIPGAWTKITWPLLGTERTLDQIEHEIIRKGFPDPRIHMALVCAAKGCPPLWNQPYVGKTLDEELDRASRRYVRHDAGVQLEDSPRRIRLSKIFDWYGQDWVDHGVEGEAFHEHGPKKAALLRFVHAHADERIQEWWDKGSFTVGWIPYDWTLNVQPR